MQHMLNFVEILLTFLVDDLSDAYYCQIESEHTFFVFPTARMWHLCAWLCAQKLADAEVFYFVH